MKKYAITTQYYNSTNFGGNLQAYALCRALQRIGVEAEQLCLDVPKPSDKAPRTLKARVLNAVRRRADGMTHRQQLRERADIRARKAKAFERFNKCAIPHSAKVYHAHDLYEDADSYAGFITGSDQVWNPDYYSPAYFLEGLPYGTKKLSYAASIAKDELTEKQRTDFSLRLKDFAGISVREEKAVELLRGIVNTNVTVSADPTLLLDRSDWDSIMAGPVVDGDYIFCYFIGMNPSARRVCADAAKRLGLPLVGIPMYANRIEYPDTKLFDTSVIDAAPPEFLSLIANAKYILTDSFHTAVFANLYKKRYVVFPRKETDTMTSRIESLMDLLDTPELFIRSVSDDTCGHVLELLQNYDYAKDTPKKSALVERSYAYLREMTMPGAEAAEPASERPLVSILSPCYNGARYLKGFLDSVLAQTHPRIELIVVDDGSTDETPDILREYEPRFTACGYSLVTLRQIENRGQAAAMNLALEHMRGEYMMWVDSDDILYPAAAERRLEYLTRHTGCDFVLSRGEIVRETDTDTRIGLLQRVPDARDDLFGDLIRARNVVFGPGTILVRTQALRRAIPSLKIHECREGQNWQLMLPLAFCCTHGYMTDVLFKYVLHGDSHSHARRSYESELERLVSFEEMLTATIRSIPGMSDAQKEKYCKEVHVQTLLGRYKQAKEHRRLPDAVKTGSQLRRFGKRVGLKDGYLLYPIRERRRQTRRAAAAINERVGESVKAYAAYCTDNATREASSSGGVFTQLAAGFDAVYGAAMSEDFTRAIMIRATTDADIARLRGSKYLQAEMGNTLRMVRKDLDSGLKVLFTGTPCQVNALRRYLGKDRENLLCADVICHGVPSPKVWQQYLKERAASIGDIHSVSFRSKKFGWNRLVLKLNDDLSVSAGDPYMRLFLKNYSLRPSCGQCAAKHHTADITLGDFWGVRNIVPEADDDRGTSLVLVRTPKGERAVAALSGIVKKRVSYAAAIKKNSPEYSSVKLPANRAAFFRRLGRDTVAALADKFAPNGHPSITKRLIKLVRGK